VQLWNDASDRCDVTTINQGVLRPKRLSWLPFGDFAKIRHIFVSVTEAGMRKWSTDLKEATRNLTDHRLILRYDLLDQHNFLPRTTVSSALGGTWTLHMNNLVAVKWPADMSVQMLLLHFQVGLVDEQRIPYPRARISESSEWKVWSLVRLSILVHALQTF
jgi:hypothetical protein